jgi:ribosomal protein S10
MKYYLYLKTNKLYILEIYISFFNKLANQFNFNLKKKMLPSSISRFSVYKSPHVYKKAKDHYQTKWYKCVLIFENLNNLYIIKQTLKNKPIELICKLKYKL